MFTMLQLKLFCTGFLQVFLVVFQTWQIARGFLPGIFIVGFLISFIWTFNVKKTAFASFMDHLAYSFGAGLGSVAGIRVGMMII